MAHSPLDQMLNDAVGKLHDAVKHMPACWRLELWLDCDECSLTLVDPHDNDVDFDGGLLDAVALAIELDPTYE